jgi:hypothetical protein
MRSATLHYGTEMHTEPILKERSLLIATVLPSGSFRVAPAEAPRSEPCARCTAIDARAPISLASYIIAARAVLLAG